MLSVAGPATAGGPGAPTDTESEVTPVGVVPHPSPEASPVAPTCRAAVLGSPIEHSLSPALHEAAYAALGLREWAYDRFAVGGAGEPDLPSFLAGCGPEWVGFSVTMPLKEAALAAGVAASAHARDVGAANTLVRAEDGWYADSTDAAGLLEALLEAGVADPRRVLVLGAGATARSAADATARLGARELSFAVRRAPRPQTLDFARRRGLDVGVVRLTDAADLVRALCDADVVVSTLPTGTRLGLPRLEPDRLAGAVLMDVVYGGWPTSLASWATEAGARVASGVPMLVHQAAEQVRLMTGHTPPVDAMRRAVAHVPGA